MRRSLLTAFGLAAMIAGPVNAATVQAAMRLATPAGPGASVGDVTFSDGAGGVRIALDLHGLPPGPHGFHVHVNASCSPSSGPDGKITPAGAAGGHMDPLKTGVHAGPIGEGHLGDLPRVEVAADGTARQALSAPRITSVDQLIGHAVMLHAGGDNYADTPAALGGGGARLACGVIGT